MKQKTLILIEGFDGVGKTTTLDALFEDLNPLYIKLIQFGKLGLKNLPYLKTVLAEPHVEAVMMDRSWYSAPLSRMCRRWPGKVVETAQEIEASLNVRVIRIHLNPGFFEWFRRFGFREGFWRAVLTVPMYWLHRVYFERLKVLDWLTIANESSMREVVKELSDCLPLEPNGGLLRVKAVIDSPSS